MSTGLWDPAVGAATTIEPEFIRRCIELGKAECWEQLPQQLSTEEQQRQSALMMLDAQYWEPLLKTLETAELIALLKFLTVAEMKFPNWRAGEKSPVITIASELKARGQALDRALLQWIRAHSDNRFLPYGAVIG